MPDADTTLYLCDKEPVSDGLRAICCLPGRCAVLMHKGEMRNGLYMPASGRLNPDCGVLVEGNFYTKGEKPVWSGPEIGSEVIVKPYDGKWIDGWHDERQLRLYGVQSPWYESIVAVRTPVGIEPTWDWVLIKRDYNDNHRLLPDAMHYSTSRGVIQSLGPRTDTLPLGERVIFKPKALEKALRFAFGADPSLILIREKELLALIEHDQPLRRQEI